MAGDLSTLEAHSVMLSRSLAKGETNMSSDEQEIRNLVATWMAATKAGDIERVLSLMAEDVVFLLPG